MTVGAIPALGQTAVTAGATTTGPNNLSVGTAEVTKASLVSSASGNRYLKVTTAKGTELYLHADDAGDVTFTSEVPGDNDGVYSKISLATGQENAIQVGTKILLFNANGHTGAISLGDATAWTNGTTSSTTGSDDAGVYAWTDNEKK
ncbi:MAG: hypothetical protein LUD46_01705 [Parabacteroides sp.]|nr:hypothetical protein [Parabacteroides sp.]